MAFMKNLPKYLFCAMSIIALFTLVIANASDLVCSADDECGADNSTTSTDTNAVTEAFANAWCDGHCQAPNSPLILSPLSLSEDEQKTIEAGKPLADVEHRRDDQGVNVAFVRAAIKINAAPQEVWSIMVDCAAAFEIIPNLEACNILETNHDGSADIREHITNHSAMLGPVRLVFHSNYVREETIYIHRIAGDIKNQEGLWRLKPSLDGQTTIVTYKTRLTTSIPVPKILVRRRLRKDFPKVLIALKEISEAKNAQQSSPEAPPDRISD